MLLLAACTPDPDPQPAEPLEGFWAHLRAAIALNTERQPIYEEMTGGASGELSEILISTERLLEPTAKDFDARAAPFHEEGIYVVAGDFVPMDDVLDVHTSPTWGGDWTDALAGELAEAVAGLAAANPADFDGVCAEALVALERLDSLEATHGVHLAMTRHSIESVAYAALHAPGYAEASGGRTTELSRDLVDTQLEAVRLHVPEEFDERAAPIHALGAGILVNDVPRIPFVEEYTGR
ncbi:MAG: hypothetical protein ACOZNI_25670 [Myxococcota bacterium]